MAPFRDNLLSVSTHELTFAEVVVGYFNTVSRQSACSATELHQAMHAPEHLQEPSAPLRMNLIRDQVKTRPYVTTVEGHPNTRATQTALTKGAGGQKGSVAGQMIALGAS